MLNKNSNVFILIHFICSKLSLIVLLSVVELVIFKSNRFQIFVLISKKVCFEMKSDCLQQNVVFLVTLSNCSVFMLKISSNSKIKFGSTLGYCMH